LPCSCLARNLRILANMRHTVDPNGDDLLAFIQCFPNVQKLAISWSRVHDTQLARCSSLKYKRGTINGLPRLHSLQILLHPNFSDVDSRDPFEKSVYELISLLRHLPLDHLKRIGVFFEAFLDSQSSQSLVQALVMTMELMRFAELNSFHFGFNFEVYGRPSLDLWVRWLRKIYTL
jgi:hypothetical protein